MSNREPGKHGLFEFAIVLLVVALLAGAGFRYFSRVIDQTWAVTLATQAQVFASAVGLLHLAWQIKGPNYQPATANESAAVRLEGTAIYVNKYGWPTHTDRTLNYSGLTAQGCAQVWLAIMQSPGDLKVVEGELTPTPALQVQRVGDRICRFTQFNYSEVRHAFDYDVINGRVLILSGNP